MNRVVSVDDKGLTYEADPRHSDLLLSSLAMTGCTGAATPGIKAVDRDEHAIKHDEPANASLNSDPDATIAAICSDMPTLIDDVEDPCGHGGEDKRLKDGISLCPIKSLKSTKKIDHRNVSCHKFDHWKTAHGTWMKMHH